VSSARDQGFATVIEAGVAPLAVAVRVTEPVFFGIPDRVTVHGGDGQVPAGPMFQDHETDEPLLVATSTLAVQVLPSFALGFAESVIVVPDEDTVTLCDALSVAPPESSTVNVTV
jgi:hypothetical protein